MPFGLCNNPSTFSRIMLHVLQGLNWKICINYLDDIIVFSESFDEHIRRLETIFDRLNQHNLKLNPKKCHFVQTTIKFLGHTISAEGIEPNNDKVKIIQEHPIPINKTQLKSFLGLVGYYRKHIENVAKIMEPLNRLLRKNIPYEWSDKCTESFETLKKTLTTAPILGFPDFNLEFQVSVDACNTSIGFILSQIQDKNERIIAYAGRSLNSHERNYSINELEALAVVSAIEYFHVYLYGRKFKVYTDNSSITWLYKQKQPRGRLARWILKLMMYTFDIIYRPGRVNSNADAVSRIPELPESLTVDTISEVEKSKFAEDQRLDPVITDVITILETNNDNKKTRDYKARFSLDSNGLLWEKLKQIKPYDQPLRLVVPNNRKSEIMNRFHDHIAFGGHRGINITYKKIRSRYCWKNMYNEIKNYCSTCPDCLTNKLSPEIRGPLCPIQTSFPFEIVGMDLMGPFPQTTSGNKYILVFIDALTKWTECVPLSMTDAPEIARILYEHVITRHGCPVKIACDTAKNFTANIMNEVCNILNVERTLSPAYTPMSNGLIERVIGTLTRILAFYVNKNQSNWDDILPSVVFAYHTSCHGSTKETPFQLLYGRKARLPNDVLEWIGEDLHIKHNTQTQNIIKNIKLAQDIAKKNNKEAQKIMKIAYDKNISNITFKVGEKVLLRDKMKYIGKSPKFLPKYKGPYILIKQLSPVTFQVGTTNKRMFDKVHVTRLKKYNAPEKRIIQPPDLINPLFPLEMEQEESTPKTEVQSPQLLKNTEKSTTPNTSHETLGDQKGEEINVLKHRHRHQKFELLVKRVGDNDNKAYWEKYENIKNYPIVREFMDKLPKPTTRSNRKVDKDNLNISHEISEDNPISSPCNSSLRTP